MRLESNRSRILVAVVLAALVALPAVSKEAPEPEVADLSATPGGLSWAPRVDYEKLTLTVKGSGHVLTTEFDGGLVTFAPVDAEGYSLPDGTYNWELTVQPRALDANNHMYRSDEPSEDGRSFKAGTAPEGRIQSGSFTIANGGIVDPGLTESPAPAAAESAAPAADIDDSDAANQ